MGWEITQPCLGKYSSHSCVTKLYPHMFQLSYDTHSQPYSCPTSRLPLTFLWTTEEIFIHFLKPFRKMMKKPRRLQKKDSWLLETCYSHTGSTATITEPCRSVQCPSCHACGPQIVCTAQYLRSLPPEQVGLRNCVSRGVFTGGKTSAQSLCGHHILTSVHYEE